MIAASWRGVTAGFATRGRDWVKRRQGQDGLRLTLHSKRIYILPTRAGLIFGGVVVILLISSMNFSNNMGFALTFLLAGIGLVSMHHCHRNLNDLRISLTDTESAFVGNQVMFHLRLHNLCADPRWQILVGWDRGNGEHLDLATGQNGSAVLRLPAMRRGPLAPPRIGISTTFPLGLFRAWSWLHIDATAIVWPQPASHADRPTAAQQTDDTGQPTEQSGDELSGLREFRDGDSPRRIDWKSLARRGELLVREYQDGTQSDAWLDWDALEGMDTETRLSTLTRLALDADAAGIPWGLRIPGVTVTPDTGATHLETCLDHLALYGLAKRGAGA